ncbi:MAG: ArgE/DapE family deacylase [Desulfovermiculus sp.]|nr:ArgE/DapE family deacylase [Desulfovermiculus sp.]
MSTITPQEQRLLQAVQDLEPEIIDFASRLVAAPSTLGNEAGAVQVMDDELSKLELSPTRVPIDPDRLADHPGFAPVPWSYDDKECVVAIRPQDAPGGRSLLFNGHLDVVSPEPLDFWDFDPFAPFVRDGWLYGRGAGDMKSGVAAMTYALHAAHKAGFGLSAPVTVEGVIEEECTGNGALACLLAGYDAQGVLIPEPFGPTLLTDQVGVLWFKIRIKGRPSHVQAAPTGTNAIEKSFVLIQALRELEEQLNQENVPSAYAQHVHPLNFNPGMLSGGDWPSTVPAWCEMYCRLSFYPGMSYPEIQDRVKRTVLEAAEKDPWLQANPPQVDFYGFRSEGHSVPLDLPALQLLSSCHHELTGEPAARYISTCTTDLRAFCLYGQGQATCFGPVAENIHAANERVRLDSVLHTARSYALFMARWCGLVE